MRTPFSPISPNSTVVPSPTSTLGSPSTGVEPNPPISTPPPYSILDPSRRRSTATSNPHLSVSVQSQISVSSSINKSADEATSRTRSDQNEVGSETETTHIIPSRNTLKLSLHIATTESSTRVPEAGAWADLSYGNPPISSGPYSHMFTRPPLCIQVCESEPYETSFSSSSGDQPPHETKPSLTLEQPPSQPTYQETVNRLRAPLMPLVSVSTGLAHADFPTSLLQFHLLTHDQLDTLARYYHQVKPPVAETWFYPAWIPAWVGGDEDVSLVTKRRRWGRFIGLKGCESPTVEDQQGPREEPEALAVRMEKEWRNALRKAEEEAMLMEKGWRDRW